MRRVLGKVSGDQGHRGRSHEVPRNSSPGCLHTPAGADTRDPGIMATKKQMGLDWAQGIERPLQSRHSEAYADSRHTLLGPRVGGRGGGTGREPGGGERPLPSIWSPPAVPKRPWGIAHQQSEAQLRWGKASVPLLCGDIRLIRKPLGRNNVLEIIIVQGGWKK